MVQKDQRAIPNTFREGVRPEEQHGSERLTQGVPMESFWGVSKEQGMPATAGVPHVGQGDITSQPAKCHSTTLAGNPCKARPVGGEQHCVGHLRAIAAK